jgi:hypothetical protein
MLGRVEQNFLDFLIWIKKFHFARHYDCILLHLKKNERR